MDLFALDLAIFDSIDSSSITLTESIILKCLWIAQFLLLSIGRVVEVTLGCTEFVIGGIFLFV